MSKGKGKAKTDEYSRLDLLQQILLRPDTYIGAVSHQTQPQWLCVREGEENKIIQREVNSVSGLTRIFIEVLSNAVDNCWKSKGTRNKQTLIEIDVDRDGRTSVFNDGRPISIVKHSEEKIYNPELIFGTLLTSSNYDDTEDRQSSGRNGYGVKLTNIFSTKFKVHCSDGKKTFRQTFTDNLNDRTDPEVVKAETKETYTKIVYYPDFKYFKLKEYSKDTIAMFKRLAVDTAMYTGITVTFNGDDIRIPNLSTYVEMFPHNPTETLKLKSSDSTVIFTTTEDPYSLSFVNGVYTEDGGVHLDAWTNLILREMVKIANNALKAKFTIRDVRPYIAIFVVCTLTNPEFKGQDKAKMTAPIPEVPKKLPKVVITKMKSWEFIDRLEHILRGRELVKLKQGDSSRDSHRTVKGLDDANLAGSRRSAECTLFVTEGDSAKKFALHLSGALKDGTDLYGAYPIRGKFLNVRKKSATDISKNTEVTDLKRALGLKHGVDYSLDQNYNSLRYGHIAILADADVDGIHIASLLLSCIYSLFPGLLQKSFIRMVRTPIVILEVNRKVQVFFDYIYYERVYAEYLKQGKKMDPHYYKGLGSYNGSDIKEYAKNPSFAEFEDDETCDAKIRLLFDKKREDDRKEWLMSYNPDELTVIEASSELESLPVSSFIDNELIRFGIYSLSRAIPSIYDGFKVSHRKVVFATLKKNPVKEIKVVQLGGYTMENTAYNHGDTSINDTIVHMSMVWVGSNNLPIFIKDGNFGSRYKGGADKANARYLKVKINQVVKKIFRPEDNRVLTYLNEDGMNIEPNYYLPIIPFVLVNGAKGIATAFATTIPAHDPIDVIGAVRRWINKENPEKIYPWYQGFTGVTRFDKKRNRVVFEGIMSEPESVGSTEQRVHITELPVGMWTETFKEHLDKMIQEGKIKGYKRGKGDPVEVVDFYIHFRANQEENITMKKLGLIKGVCLTNMVLLDKVGVPHKYTSVQEIIDVFCDERLVYYTKRKEVLLEELNAEYQEKMNKARYINDINAGMIQLMGIPEKDLIRQLVAMEFWAKSGKFDYLLDMSNRSLTEERALKLKMAADECRLKIKKLMKKGEREMWLEDLDDLEKAL
jgi:DNA topoisomerase-2